VGRYAFDSVMDRAFEFLQGGLARLRSSSSHFLLNLADLTQIDSSGVNIIVKTYHSLRGQSGDLRLLRPSGHALEVFRAPHLILLRSTSTGKTRDLGLKGWRGLMNVDWSGDRRSLFITSYSHEGDSTLLNVTLDGRASVLLHFRDEVFSAIPSPYGRLLAITEDSGAKNVRQIENF